MKKVELVLQLYYKQQKCITEMLKLSKQSGITVNSLMFARDLFGKSRNHLQIANINTPKHNLCA